MKDYFMSDNLSLLQGRLMGALYLLDKPVHGLGLQNYIKEKIGVEVGLGSLYPTLQRLVAEEYLSEEWGNEQTGPRRKYYNLTDKGKEAVEAQGTHREFDNGFYTSAVSENLRCDFPPGYLEFLSLRQALDRNRSDS